MPKRAAQKTENVAHYVEDACGEKFLFTVAGPDYAPQFRKHARWWVRYATRPSAHLDRDSAGNRIRQPVKPVKIVVEPQP
jgi:hypothetical protein